MRREPGKLNIAMREKPGVGTAMSVEQVAAIFNLTFQRIEQIESGAIRRIWREQLGRRSARSFERMRRG